MAGARQPTDLIIAKGKKHLTKAEIEERKAAEIKAPSDNVKPPSYLSKQQKKEFREIVKQLLEINLVTNLDCEALARLIVSQTHYREVTEQIAVTPLIVKINVPTGGKNDDGSDIMEMREVVSGERERLMIIQDRCFKQCRQAASDFGLTVSSRCKLVVPKAPEADKTNKFSKFAR